MSSCFIVMRILSILRIVLLILLLNACSTTECLYISDEDFPETIRLEKKGGFDIVARVDAMIIVGDMLLIRADQSSDIFSLYDLKGNLRKVTINNKSSKENG